ncbi:MAG TPA: hypothetical protein VF940_30040 [Streptosporangiaceae bacterium]
MSRLADDGARVLVTAKCSRRHHVLAEYVAVPAGEWPLRVRDQLEKPRTPEDPHWDRVFGSLGVVGNGLSVTTRCPCGRAHLLNLTELETAAAAGKSVVIVDPVRGSMP